MLGMELDGGLERNEGQWFADELGEDKLVWEPMGKHPLGCNFSYRKRLEPSTEPFLHYRIPQS